MRTPVPVKQSFLCLLSFLFIAISAQAQVPVYGCKDPTALNHSAAATIDNNSCKYQKKIYTPPPQKFDSLSAALKETSGLQWAANALWSFNDGGNSPALFRIDTVSDAVLQTVVLENATNTDWEDIAFDGTYFYIGDFGNNTNGDRDDLKIYKFPLSAIPVSSDDVVTVPSSAIDIISFSYNDQPLPLMPAGLNKTKYDCEAMIVDGGNIHLFSKNWNDKTTTHYVIGGTAAGSYVATATEVLATGYLVTAADKVPGANTVVLLGYLNELPGYHFLTVLSNYSNGSYFNGITRLIDLPSALEMGQAEGLTFRNGRYGYISNEWVQRTINPFPPFTVRQRLYSFDMAAFAPDLVLPLSLLQFDVQPANGQQRINWLFSEPAVQVTVQHSRNGTDFTNLQTYHHSISGMFRHQPSAGVNYYRLAWKEKNGGDKFSTILRASASAKNELANVVLSASGQLQLVNTGSRTDAFQARLLTVDGRTLARAARFTLVPGINRLQFAKPLQRNALLLLQLKNDKEEYTKLLRVE